MDKKLVGQARQIVDFLIACCVPAIKVPINILLQFNEKPPNNYKIEENLKKTAALLRNGFLKLPKISVSPEVSQPYVVCLSSTKKQIYKTNFFHDECLAKC